jgi:hypothetical protein
MPMNFLFWMIYIIAILFAGWTNYEQNVFYWRRFSGYLVLFVLVGLLGYQVFGPAVKH